MNLRTEAIAQRLRTLLEFHQKLQMENVDAPRTYEVADKIRQLTFLLERANATPMSRTVVR